MRFFIALFISAAPLTVAMNPFPQIHQKIDKKFEEYQKDYGSKYANLKILEEGLKGTSAKVPPFVGISSAKLIGFIQDKLGLKDIGKEWENIQAEESREKFLEKAKAFHDKIFGAFQNAKFKKEDLDDLTDKTDLLEQKDIKLMVRSTGREDSKTFSNAGGNESVANVPSDDVQKIFEAIAKVVCSYVSEKSLQQRLDAGETFGKDPLFLPILIQKMIGEPEGNKDPKKIPVSGVFFTVDPQGVRIQKDLDLILIQSTFGHNEGVVNSAKGIVTDTYRMDRSGAIYPVLRPKPFRLRPIHGKELEETPNGDFGYHSSLSLLQLKKLQELSYKIVELYPDPQDIEFVFEGDNLYVVQTRPLTHLDSKTQPTYLKRSQFINPLRGETLVSNGGIVLKIEDPKAVIQEEDLGKALEKYNNLKAEEKEKIQLVLSKTPSPVTSHEATIFRGQNKPVLIMENADSLIASAKKDKAVYVCVQQGLMGMVSDVTETPGVVAYPMMRGLSVSPKLSSQQEDFDKTLGSLNDKIKGQKETVKGFKGTFQEWLDLELSDPSKEIGLLQFLHKLFLDKEGKLQKSCAPEFSQKFVSTAFDFLKDLEKDPKNQKGKLLFLQKVLESLYYQRELWIRFVRLKVFLV